MEYTKAQQLSGSEKKVCKQKDCRIKVKDSDYCSLHSSLSKKPSKYNAVRQTYNGYNYDSKREAQEAFKLDQLIKSGEVIRWERQVKIPLRINDITVANYYIDFKVYNADGSIDYLEVKGAETAIWRLKFKLAKVLYPDWNFVVTR